MTDDVESLLIEVRASTDGFSRDIARMRGTVDSELVNGFSRAGDVLQKGLTGAIARGRLDFGDFKRMALSALDEIAAQATRTLVSSAIGGVGVGSMPDLGSLAASLLGLPGRATGGNVAPGRGYLVGERGPEMFVPTSAGRIEPAAASPGREVRVAINVTTPRGASVPQSLQRSSRQLASAVRRALAAS